MPRCRGGFPFLGVINHLNLGFSFPFLVFPSRFFLSLLSFPLPHLLFFALLQPNDFSLLLSVQLLVKLLFKFKLFSSCCCCCCCCAPIGLHSFPYHHVAFALRFPPTVFFCSSFLLFFCSSVLFFCMTSKSKYKDHFPFWGLLVREKFVLVFFSFLPIQANFALPSFFPCSWLLQLSCSFCSRCLGSHPPTQNALLVARVCVYEKEGSGVKRVGG